MAPTQAARCRDTRAVSNSRPQDHKSAARSSVLLVLAVAPDDVGDVVALVFVRLQEGVVLGAVVGDLDILLLGLGVAVGRGLLLGAAALRIRLLERNELDVRGLRSLRGLRHEGRN